jgi:hypothetical protein
MSIDIRLPNINAPTTEGQMAQMQSYMHQLVEQLNWALNTVNNAQNGNASNIVIEKPREDISPEEAENTFNSIKALIIKSADIVKAYEQTMKTTYNGEYIAVSDFGTYMEETERNIEENSKYTNEVYNRVETITNESGGGRLDGLENDVQETNAYIKRGLLGDHPIKIGEEAYGIAVGQTDINGNYRGYAWFISDGLFLFDENGYNVAYVSQNKLNIKDAIFHGTLQLGKYQIDTTDGLAFTWVGG